MPRFETEVDITPSEFLDVCTSRDIEKLIDCLIEDDFISEEQVNEFSVNLSEKSLSEINFIEKLRLIEENYYQLSVEEENMISSISKKFI